MNIVILDGYTLNPGDLSWDEFKELGKLTVYDRTGKDELTARLKGAEAVFTNKVPITAEVLDANPGIKFIGVLATGFNVVDIKAAADRGIPVCNIPTYGTSAVSQFVFAQLLNICHHVQDHADSVNAGDWTAAEDWCYWNFPLTELAGKTMGIIGFGRIGQAVGRIANAFGMKVIAYDEFKNPSLESDVMQYTGLDTVFTESDVISLHCPLTPATEGLVNRENILKMKDGVILINTSRGPLVVESDLAEALNRGKLRAAGLDVVSTEPIKADNPLLKAKNCYITPHIAWAPSESRKRLMDIAVENLKSFINGKVINQVN